MSWKRCSLALMATSASFRPVMFSEKMTIPPMSPAAVLQGRTDQRIQTVRPLA